MALTEQQQVNLTHQLQARDAELRDEIRQELLKSDSEIYAELAGQVHDHAEESIANLLVDVELAVIDQRIASLREIETALERLSAGNYGVCIGCGDEIPLARLESQPTASRCLTCQKALEGVDAHAIPSL